MLLRVKITASGRGLDVRKSERITYLNTDLIEEVDPDYNAVHTVGGRTYILSDGSLAQILGPAVRS
jgi:hypothetical protein